MNQYQTSDGTHIAFEQYGTRDSPIVFIHGAYIDFNEWQPQIPRLAHKSYLLVDLRGHGQSGRQGYPYSVARFAQDIAELLNHLNLRNVAVCGHSLGGMVAQRLASHHPDLVEKLILADTSYGVRSTWLESLMTSATLPLFNLVPVPWQAKLFADQIGKHSAGAREYVYTEISKHTQNKRNYREIWKAVVQFSGYSDLEKIRSSTLIVAGALNQQTHKQARMMNERIHSSSLVLIDHAGHMLNWDNPEQFNRMLLDFVEQ